MALDVHHPYPGVSLVVTSQGSLLFGVPADAFKATKQYCANHDLPLPRVLVAPQTMLVAGTPQFNPEFFLYDFLFMYGQAFRPELADERLVVVVDRDQAKPLLAALDLTLNGPSRADMRAFRDANGKASMPKADVERLADIAESMALRRGGRRRTLDDMITQIIFDAQGKARLLDGSVEVERDGPQAFVVRSGREKTRIDLAFRGVVTPFSTLPTPAALQTPSAFGIKTLGTRNGFDLSGPTTGFVIWVNGRAVIYDGPVGTRYLLAQQGISNDDVEAVILSHCHEDHMGAFAELILQGRRPKIYTAEPIYRSALTKLSAFFRAPESVVATYVDYHRVTPGVPFEALGATWDFFYTVHTIPTIGVSVSMRREGATHRIQISGDTLHHEGLDKMQADGILPNAYHQRMRNLVPATREPHALYFTDVGEAIIHGHPKDWADNPNSVHYYHCPDNDHTRNFGHDISAPGDMHNLIRPRKLHPLIPARLLNALRFLEIDDARWLTTMLYRGHSYDVDAGTWLMHEGEAKGKRHTFTVIVSGSAQVSTKSRGGVAQLCPGDYFGPVELLEDVDRQPASIQAETPMELFDIDAALLHDYVAETGMAASLKQLWKTRPLLETLEILARLDLATRNQLAASAVTERHAAGAMVARQGAPADALYVVVRGKMQLQASGDNKVVAILAAGDCDSFFGEACLLLQRKPTHHLTAKATTAVTLLRIDAATAQRLLGDQPSIRLALQIAAAARRRPTTKAAKTKAAKMRAAKTRAAKTKAAKTKAAKTKAKAKTKKKTKTKTAAAKRSTRRR